ncbi:hypothetical protein GCM10007913_11420 [Devosia yakushimensis]|uniref:OmpR/PhoB-type domain-containing protein n=1 Tax=Devosia yakushimensis TaxID=470028 RepID=A0ABQ5UAR6_9HYPH|nr:winged helix-turn-helix domain-containing protein [Devosia yakushimensis]GLQ09210.1 hypothetical protein GCM10007913_11420 [Devosia yakushimensis]
MLSDLEQRQQNEIETLRERIRQLEELLLPSNIPVPVEWCLTGKEMRVFSHLASRDMGTKASIMAALYSDRIDEEPNPKIVDVFVCKLRAKLKPYNVHIRTIWGTGYALDDREQFLMAVPA